MKIYIEPLNIQSLRKRSNQSRSYWKQNIYYLCTIPNPQFRELICAYTFGMFKFK